MAIEIKFNISAEDLLTMMDEPELPSPRRMNVISIPESIPMNLPSIKFNNLSTFPRSAYMLDNRLFVILKNGSVIGQEHPNSLTLKYQFDITQKHTDNVEDVVFSEDKRFFVYVDDITCYCYDSKLQKHTVINDYSVNYRFDFYNNELLLIGSSNGMILVNLLTHQSVNIKASTKVDYIKVEKGKYIIIDNLLGIVLLDYYTFVEIAKYENVDSTRVMYGDNVLYIHNKKKPRCTMITPLDKQVCSLINKMVGQSPNNDYRILSVIDQYTYCKMNDGLYLVSKNQDKFILLHKYSFLYDYCEVFDNYVVSIDKNSVTLYKTMKHSRDLGYWLLLHEQRNTQLFEQKVIPLIASYIW